MKSQLSVFLVNTFTICSIMYTVTNFFVIDPVYTILIYKLY